jgi:3-hydroxybutyryl-CoA dehydrogenase
MTIHRIGIVGGGLMGSGIAEVSAKAGLDVTIREIDEVTVSAARSKIEKSTGRAVDKGKLEAEAREEILERITYTTNLADLADRQLIVEAITENEPLKLEIFKTLDEVVEDEEAILASNTSSIPITRLAKATSRPDSVVGLHFFNPVPVMGLVELISTVLSSPEVEARAELFACEQLEKTVIHAKDRAGFIVNMLLVPFLLEAIRLYENGVATAEDIDTGMRLGANHPMGPLTLADFVGLDTCKAVADVLYTEFKQPQYAPPPLLVRMVEAGLLGRKSGRGFYEYQ